MASPPQRLLQTSAAAVLGAGWYLTLFAVIVALGLAAIQQASLWFETGATEPTPPPAARPASHRGDVSIAGATPIETRAVNDALANLRYRPPSGDIAYKIAKDLPPQTEGMFVSGINLIQLRQATVLRGGAALRRTLAHEIGHYVDANLLTDEARARFYRLRGIPPKRPWLGANQRWEKTPSEDFAEVFASLALPRGEGKPLTAYGPVTNTTELEKMLRGVGVRLGRSPTPPPERSAVARKLTLASRVLADSRSRRLLLFGALLSGAYGAITWGRKSWRHPRWALRRL